MSNLITRQTQQVTDSRIKVNKIISFLKAFRGPHSIHNIRAKTRTDLQKAENVNVKLSLQKNPKVSVLGTTFEYQPTIPNINNKDELRIYIQKHAEGVASEDLDDAYVSAKSDIANWLQSGRIVQFMNSDTKQHMTYWYFGRLRKHPIQLEKEKEIQQKQKDKEKINNNNNNNNIDDEEEEKINIDEPEEINDGAVDTNLFPLIGDAIIATWSDIKIPSTKEELQRSLEEVNLISGAFSKKRTRQKAAIIGGNKKKKRKLNLNRLNITNTHMLHDQDLKEKLTAQNDKVVAGKKERELPPLPGQKQLQ